MAFRSILLTKWKQFKHKTLAIQITMIVVHMYEYVDNNVLVISGGKVLLPLYADICKLKILYLHQQLEASFVALCLYCGETCVCMYVFICM